ncbi:MAG: hypothetical protein NVS1B10_02510 [Candidatus Saccharimonadales bacterium]
MSKVSTTTTTNTQTSSNNLLVVAAWAMALTVSIVGTIAWGKAYGWHLLPLNIYQLFPLLGIIAFSIMWTHYITATFRDLTGTAKEKLASYYKYTGYLVLALICLHPGLLIFQRFRDGAGFPPHSYESYVAPGLGWVTLLGTTAWLIFIAFEFHRKFGHKSWWHYVQDSSDLAMLFILYHGLRLGTSLQTGWFRSVWYFYTLTFVAVLIRKYYIRLQQRLHTSSPGLTNTKRPA